MRFQSSSKFLAGAVDVDPVAAPATILEAHYMKPKAVGGKVTEKPEALYLALMGAGGETVTLDLYFLIESQDLSARASEYKSTTTRWFRFATGIVVTNGTLQVVTTGLPAGGIIYARRTADTIAGGETRELMMAWNAAAQ